MEEKKRFVDDNPSKDAEKSKAGEEGEVREGQEDSSILNDKEDEDLPRKIREDTAPAAQEEFIDDKNANKANKK